MTPRRPLNDKARAMRDTRAVLMSSMRLIASMPDGTPCADELQFLFKVGRVMQLGLADMGIRHGRIWDAIDATVESCRHMLRTGGRWRADLADVVITGQQALAKAQLMLPTDANLTDALAVASHELDALTRTAIEVAAPADLAGHARQLVQRMGWAGGAS